MMKRLQDEPSWCEALTIVERVDALPPDGIRLSETDLRRGERRLKKWKAQAPFSNGSFFAHYLEMVRLNEDKFQRVLGCPPSAFCHCGRMEPDWLKMLSTVLDENQFCGDGAQSDLEYPDGVFEALRPFIQYGRQQLRTLLTSIRSCRNGLPYSDEVLVSLLTRRLATVLLQATQRTYALELNVARLRGELNSGTPEERYQEFFKRFRFRNNCLQLFAEYPVLARNLCTRLSDWLNFAEEFIRHLIEDWPEVRSELLPGPDPGEISTLNSMAGDLHRRGRSVIVVGFKSGAHVVYKPRSLDAECRFNELMTWCNTSYFQPQFHLLKAVSRKGHGWVEYVENLSCNNLQEIRDFYRRLGGLLCLLYVLEATDVHYENLIACGPHPIFIDLEALFQPRQSQFVEDEGVRFLQKVYEETVLRTSILPQRLWVTGKTGGLDISGIWGGEEQITPFLVPQLKGLGTDQMCFVEGSGRMPASANRPLLAGEKVPLQDHAENVVEGFTNIYRMVVAHRDELCASGGLLDAFAEDEIRVILRPTRIYARLLDACSHPDALRSGVERDRLLDRIWVGIEQKPVFSRMVPGERADLANGDVPIFTTKPGSTHAWTSAGTVIPDLLERSGLELSKARIRSMNDADLCRQIAVIRGSLASLESPNSRDIVSTPISEPRAAIPPTQQQLLEAARKIASRIEDAAHEDGDLITWMNLTSLTPDTWTMLPAVNDLYSGLTGIAFFFAHLAAATKCERYRSLAERILRTVLACVKAVQVSSGSRRLRLGAFTGDAGLIYLLCHLSRLWDNVDLLNRAEEIANECEATIAADEEFDWLSGVAGYACVLECLFRCTGSKSVLDQAYRCGHKLIESGKPLGEGLAWTANSTGGVRLTGLAHGAAGISLALLRLSALTGDREFRDAAVAGIRFEQGQFSADMDDWLPFHSDRGPVPGQVAWCNGAAGIGWARIKSLPLHPGIVISSEIDTALRITEKRGFGHTHCLCHGDLGNAEFLYEAGFDLNRPDLKARAQLRIADCLAASWQCGTPTRLETPSFMTGLAGIGYSLIRAAFPNEFPSVLMLECAPPANVSSPSACS